MSDVWKSNPSAGRREFVKAAAAGAASLMLPGLLPSAAHAAPSGDVILRRIPRTGETLPAIGLGAHGPSRVHLVLVG